MMDFCQLTNGNLRVGNLSDIQIGGILDVPTSPGQAFFARDTRQLFICDLNMTWRDVGLYRYTVLDITTAIPSGAQVTWSEELTIDDDVELTVLDGGAFYIVG